MMAGEDGIDRLRVGERRLDRRKVRRIDAMRHEAERKSVGALDPAAGTITFIARAAEQAVTEFEDATIAVGKFRDATGTTSEEASRFVEVFDDLGVGAEAGSAAIGRMEKVLGQNAHAFDEYGV